MAWVRCGWRTRRVGRRHPLVGHHGPQLACLGRHAVALRLSIPSQVAQVTMPHDIFISYSRRDLAAVKPIKEELEAQGFSCWMDLEGIESGSEEFTDKIAEAVCGSATTLFFLSDHSQKSRWSLNELRVARDEGKHVVLVRFNDNKMQVKFKLEFGGADIIDWRVLEQRGKLLGDLAEWSARKSSQQQAASSGIWQADPEFIRRFDKPVYDKLEKELESFRVLDLGSGNGEVAMSRFQREGKSLKYLGIDCERQSVDAGNTIFGKAGERLFLKADLEDASCPKTIELGMQELGISDFNVVNVTMVLLYLKEPLDVLKMVRKYMAKNGTIVIRDIDDGLSIAFPDKDNLFSQAIDLCNAHKTSGMRKNGRETYTKLRQAGFRDIQLDNLCVSTCGMDSEGREELFNYYFGALLNDLQSAAKNNYSNAPLNSDLEKFRCNFASLRSRFITDDFFFTLGLVLFTARGGKE